MTDRLERLINLVIALRETRRPLPAEEIRRRVAGYGQDDHEAFRRMFERDKADLRALGVPLETAALDRWDDRQGYRIDPGRYDLPEIDLAPDELTALAVAVQATGLMDQATAGLRKLEVAADRPGETLQASDPVLGVPLDAPHRQALMEAQLTRTVVRFRYQPPGRGPAERTVDPHALVHRAGHWYLVGRDHDRAARRAYRLDRIVGAVATVGPPEAFTAPDQAIGVDDVVPQAATELVDAEVAASPDVAWQVARRARGGGYSDPDGWTRYTVTGDLESLVSWVLGFGADVEVRAPRELRDAVVARLRILGEGQSHR